MLRSNTLIPNTICSLITTLFGSLARDLDFLDTLKMCCVVCDGTFFPSLLEEMSAVVGFFNARAQKLLQIHLSSGLSKCVIWFRNKAKKNPIALTQEGRDLVTYAIINAIAMRKILKKYDKVSIVCIYLELTLTLQSMCIFVVYLKLLFVLV